MKTKKVSKETIFHVVILRDESDFKYDTLLSTPSREVAFEQYRYYKNLYEFQGIEIHVCIIAKSYSVNVLFE